MSTRLFDPDTAMKATISDCGQYRYDLSRRWGEGQNVCWVMLNPSTADGTKDDPTIRRVMRFSQEWGFGGVVVVNLFALRATDPKELPKHPDPVGPENDERAGFWIRHLPTVVAWGALPFAMRREAWVKEQAWFNASPLSCLGTTKFGAPRHPLYVPADTSPVPWPAPTPEDQQGGNG